MAAQQLPRLGAPGAGHGRGHDDRGPRQGRDRVAIAPGDSRFCRPAFRRKREKRSHRIQLTSAALAAAGVYNPLLLRRHSQREPPRWLAPEGDSLMKRLLLLFATTAILTLPAVAQLETWN